jgi:sugar lactone lactonase YvrE
MRKPFLLAAAVALAGSIAAFASAAAKPFPETIALPDGFRPEGIAVGPSATFYVGSIGTGAVFRGDLRTGEGEILVAGGGRGAIGVDVDSRGRLFVAGGNTGQAYVYDARTGAEIAVYQLTDPPTFVNDVVVTRSGAYFTDSLNPFLYRIPIGPGGALAESSDSIPLSGDIVYTAGNNANGIDATPNGKTLVIVQSNAGKLFTVDPLDGVTDEIDLGGEGVPNGDGILLDGRMLYVVQNRLNLIALIELAPDLSAGTVVRRFTDPRFDVPTTIAEHGDRLYAVNARFTTPPTPSTTYTVVQVGKP